MIDHNKACVYCGEFPPRQYHPIKVERNGFSGFAVECESCGARGPFGRDALEAVTRFENPWTQGLHEGEEAVP
jgi:hypothetical protein